MEARSKTIEAWFSMIDEGQVLLPRFQRHEAWRAAQIEGALENVLRSPSLPIGALLTLDVGDKELFHSRPIVGAPAPKEGSRPSMHLLDGQQRMTALWRSLSDNYEDLTLFVGTEESDSPDVEIVRRWEHKGVRRPVWADDASETFQRRFMPVRVLRPGARGEKALDEWSGQATDDPDERRKIERWAGKLRQRVAGYVVPFLSLPVSTDQEVALDVFIKMNTSATPLSDFDIVVAQVEGAMAKSLHEMIDELCARVPSAREYGNIEDIILAVGALLLGKPPLKKTYLETEFGGGLSKVWDSVRDGLDLGLGFLRQEGIFDEKRLPTDVAVTLTCALWANVERHGGDAEGRARTLIRKALWRTCFTDRYLKTSATRTFADFRSLLGVISGLPDATEPELFDETVYPLPSIEELVRAGWPTRKDRLPRAILAASLREGGWDFADGAPATASHVQGREYHHIFPVGILGGNRSDEAVNRALNCALITWRTNRTISANSPREYLEKRSNAAHLGEEEVKARLRSHLIPYDALMKEDYDAFLSSRARLVDQRMRQLVNGESPQNIAG